MQELRLIAHHGVNSQETRVNGTSNHQVGHIKEARCLQESIGNCLGCPIREMAAEKCHVVSPDDRGEIVKRIAKQYCPEGNVMSISTSSRKLRMW